MSVCQTSSASDVVLLVFVLLVLGDLGDAQRLVLGAAVGLRGRVADVVAALIHVVRALVAVAVLVHGVEQDEDTEGCGSHNTHHHSCGAAGLLHLNCAWEPSLWRCGIWSGNMGEIWGVSYSWDSAVARV